MLDRIKKGLSRSIPDSQRHPLNLKIGCQIVKSTALKTGLYLIAVCQPVWIIRSMTKGLKKITLILPDISEHMLELVVSVQEVVQLLLRVRAPGVPQQRGGGRN